MQNQTFEELIMKHVLMYGDTCIAVVLAVLSIYVVLIMNEINMKYPYKHYNRLIQLVENIY